MNTPNSVEQLVGRFVWLVKAEATASSCRPRQKKLLRLLRTKAGTVPSHPLEDLNQKQTEASVGVFFFVTLHFFCDLLRLKTNSLVCSNIAKNKNARHGGHFKIFRY